MLGNPEHRLKYGQMIGVKKENLKHSQKTNKSDQYLPLFVFWVNSHYSRAGINVMPRK